MKDALIRHFESYEGYHRHPVNRAIHKLAIPAIVFHVVAMLDWVKLAELGGGGFPLTLAHPVLLLGTLWYLRLAPRLGWLVVVPAWLALPLGWVTPWPAVVAVALIAWIAQFIGHGVYEKRSPAFFDNLVQLLVGPLYVAALWSGAWPRKAPAGQAA